jgi:hypothetical protein
VKTIVNLFNQQSTDPPAHEVNCFDDDVIFEDAACRLKGLAELTAAFSALSAHTRPETVDWEFVGEWKHYRTIVVDIWQQYPRWVHGSRELQLYSRIVVQYDEHGNITQVQDLWRGAPIPESLPFSLARRANGLISHNLLPASKHVVLLRTQMGHE